MPKTCVPIVTWRTILDQDFGEAFFCGPLRVLSRLPKLHVRIRRVVDAVVTLWRVAESNCLRSRRLETPQVYGTCT